jgi:ATP-dependent DNA helicase DinG
MSLRFLPEPAAALRAAIRDAGGVEVFAVGDVEREAGAARVTAIEVHARGTADAVLALRSRPRAGQVVIHNHPSGDLRPSSADTHLAGNFGEDGVGFIIVDNEVRKSNWVVEPMARVLEPVDPQAIRQFFEDDLPSGLPGWEPRPAQTDMAERVGEALSNGGALVVEAGTGTGKSLAYLVPAALWAMRNDSKVAVSTYTRALQQQLMGDDLPLLHTVFGSSLRSAVLKGRGNYLCRRKLAALDAEGPEADRLREWAATSQTGERSEIPGIEEDLWEDVESDSDHTLRARCPHFNTCFYYQARRKAAAAHVIVVNHALLLADLSLKDRNNGNGILPAFDRIVLDEAHHLESAATTAGEQRLSELAIRRAVARLLPRARRPGAIYRLASRSQAIEELLPDALDALRSTLDCARITFYALGRLVPLPMRLPTPFPEGHYLTDMAQELERVCGRLGAIEALVDDEALRPDELQPFKELQRARKRLQEQADVARGLLQENNDWCRYIASGRRGAVSVIRAPIDVAPFLRQHLGPTEENNRASVMTSATLTVQGRFDHYLERTGLSGADLAIFPGPFDYARQALLLLPRDLPPPSDADWMERVAEVVADAITVTQGGAFVLCTSHDTVRRLAAAVRVKIAGALPILEQTEGGQGRVLEQFRADRQAVLFGTDSFWEGVSVRGEGLRLVIIPRLPFRPPNEPVAEARHERLQQRGVDPFYGFTLPQAVIKLRQGFGRLVRSTTDRGVVIVLDRRIHDHAYGRVFLASLPPARRFTGPWRAALGQLRGFYQDEG